MSQESVAVVRQAYEAFEAGEFSEVLGLLHPNIKVIPAKEVPGLAPAYHGREGFLEFLGAWFAPWDDYSIEVEELIDAGDRVVTDEHQVGRSHETGLEVDQRIYDVWTVEDGALVEARIFYDKREALEAAGLEA